MATFTVFVSNDGLIWTKAEQVYDASYMGLMKKVKNRSVEEARYERIHNNAVGEDIICFHNGATVPLDTLVC